MGKVRDWIMEHCVDKQINHLLEEKEWHFRPQDYFLKIIHKIDITQFESMFADFKKKYPTVGHEKHQIPRLGLLHNHIKSGNFSAVSKINKENGLSHYDNNTCFIYFFTVEEEFNTTHSTEEKEIFLKNFDGLNIDPIQYETAPGTVGEVHEKLIYVGMSTDISSRLKAHEVYRKLHQERFKNANKYIYIAEITFHEEIVYEDVGGEQESEVIVTPLDVIKPIKLVNNILSYLESMLITQFKIPEFNKRDTVPKIFFYTDKVLDPWDKISAPDTIRIASYNDSIFFKKATVLNREDQLEILRNIPEDELREHAKKAGYNFEES